MFDGFSPEAARSCQFLTCLVNLSLKAFVMASLCVLVIRLFRIDRAPLVHALWLGIPIGMVIYPILFFFIPLHFVSLPIWEIPSETRMAFSSRVGISHYGFLMGLYLLGVAASIFRLSVGLIRQRELRLNAVPISVDPRLLSELGHDGLKRVRFLESSDIRVPVTFGWFTSWVLLPSDWNGWNGDKLKAVVAHENAHILRGDYRTQLLVRFIETLFWFHPLLRWARNRISMAAEHCADEMAVTVTGDPVKYARHLLEIASAMENGPCRSSDSALALVTTSDLETRIDRLLQKKHTPKSSLRLRILTVILLLGVAWYLSVFFHVIAKEPSRNVICLTPGRC
jgi:beta-lactamase regulating signal transducer with metallopeptidase domain